MDLLLFKVIRIFVFWNLILGGCLFTLVTSYGATMRRHGETPSLRSVLSSASVTTMTIGVVITIIAFVLFIREFRSAV